MKKTNQKKHFFLLAIVSFFVFNIFVNSVFSAGSATVSWIPPTTDEGGGALTGLAGYRVYYDTTSRWATSCPLDAGNYVNVTGGSVSSYAFEDTLTAGQTHYFTVVAYDYDNNISGCASDGTDTEVSKLVSYTADMNGDQRVNILDFNLFRSNWGNTNCSNAANFLGKTSNCSVNILDFNVLRSDFGNSF